MYLGKYCLQCDAGAFYEMSYERVCMEHLPAFAGVNLDVKQLVKPFALPVKPKPKRRDLGFDGLIDIGMEKTDYGRDGPGM